MIFDTSNYVNCAPTIKVVGGHAKLPTFCFVIEEGEECLSVGGSTRFLDIFRYYGEFILYCFYFPGKMDE